MNAFARVGLRLFVPWCLGLGLLSAFGCDRSGAIQTGLRRVIDSYAAAQARHFRDAGTYAGNDVVQSWPSTLGLVGVTIEVRFASSAGHHAVAVSARRPEIACAIWVSRSDPGGAVACGTRDEVAVAPQGWREAATPQPEAAAQAEPLIVPGLQRFRARHVRIDPDTVWFTESEECPEYAAAFIRRTSSWVRAMRRDCRGEATRDPGRRGSVVSGSTTLTRGLRLEHVRASADTGNGYYVLHGSDGSTTYPLLIADSIAAAAQSTWSEVEYDSVLPFSRTVASWFDDGHALYFGLDGEYRWDCTVGGPCIDALSGSTGGLLQFDPDAGVVKAIVDRRLQTASVRKMFTADENLWVVALFPGFGRNHSVYRYDTPRQEFTAFFDSVAGRNGGRPRDADAAGDTVWIATAQTVAAFSVRDTQWTRRFYHDSLAVLVDGSDTVYTLLARERPAPGDTLLQDCPIWGGDDPEEVVRLLACDLNVRRRIAFIAAAAALSDSMLELVTRSCASYGATRAVTQYDNDLWSCPGWDWPDGGVVEPLTAFLADSSLYPFLHDALPRATIPGYAVALRALKLLGDDLARDALRAALDAGAGDSRTMEIIRDLLALDDSTGVQWARRAVRAAAADDAGRMARLVEEFRDPQSVEPLIGLIAVADAGSLETLLRALVSLTAADSAPPYQRSAHEDSRARAEAFWRAWWELNGNGFLPVSEEIGEQAVARWRRRRVP